MAILKTEKFAVREAAEVTFIDLATQKPIVTLDTLKVSTLKSSSSTDYARGGVGNPKLIGFTGDKEMPFTIQDALFDLKALALITGNKPTAGTADQFYRAAFVVNDDTAANGITLDTGVTKLQVFIDGEEVAETTDYTFGTDKLTLTAAEVGQKVEVYGVKAGKGATTIHFSAKSFPATVKIIAEVLVRDLETGQDFVGNLVIPKAKINDDFQMDFSPEGDPSVLDIPTEILQDPAEEDMVKLIIFDNETE